VIEVQPPKAKIRIARALVTKSLAALLSQHAVDDIAVEDPPLEEVIAAVFRRANEAAEIEAQAARDKVEA
jgi:ABC-2 type transport system ATP-binding protein